MSTIMLYTLLLISIATLLLLRVPLKRFKLNFLVKTYLLIYAPDKQSKRFKNKRELQTRPKPPSLKHVCFFVVLLCFVVTTWSQENDGIAISFAPLRQNDQQLKPNSSDKGEFYQKLKDLQLTENVNMSLGGSYRLQVESFINEEFGSDENQDNIWLLNRFFLHSHIRIGKKIDFFSELSSSTVVRKDELSSADKDVMAFNQLFVQYRFLNHWAFLAGRENLSYGAGRIIDFRDVPNVRRSFDLVKVKYRHRKLDADLFFASKVNNRVGSFDNRFLEFDETVLGAYFVKKISSLWNMDLYYLYQKQNNVIYNNIAGNERRSTIGLRYFGEWNDWSFNTEVVHQFGSFESSDISAQAYYLQIDYAFQNSPISLRIGTKLEFIDGDDDPNDSKVGNFDALYPKGAYFGRVARFGPSNLVDVHPYLNFKKGRFFYEFDFDFFWRESTRDGVYNPALQLEYPSLNGEPFIASQIGTFTSYEVNKFMSLEFETNFIFPGSFLRANGLSENLFHFLLSAEFKF